ncbi:MAG TPA: DUF2663 family protein [Bacillus bacterium]|nr:DUF2663 family protein [Bacillus sp. (in: firmicutes)]
MHHYLDEVGQVIIKDLLQLKRKFDKKEAELRFYKLAFLVIVAFFIGYLLFFIVMPYRFHYGMMISLLVNNVYHYLFIAVIVTIHSRLKFVEKKADMAEKDFNTLRCEVIQRSEELWPDGEKRKQRHHFFIEMKEKYNINLYYESD